MKKKIFLLFTISFAIGLLITPKVEAAVGEWIGDYCDSCGSYGSAGKCDSVTKTSVGLFRVSFYLNGKKIGTSVNVSRDASYQKLASDAKWHWGDGKTDIVSYASGTSLGNPTSGGLSSIIIPGISTHNVQTVLSPSKSSKNVQKILNEAGITEFKFKDGKIYYTPSGDECQGEYQIQMVVEAMQVINWLCVEGGTDNHRWIGTPYELNNGLIAQGYNSKKGGNGYSSGSVVDKNLLSALRLDESVKIGSVSFSPVTDCLTVHVRGYDAHEGYGFNVYDLTGDFEITCKDDKCKYDPSDPTFKEECCDDTAYLDEYYKANSDKSFILACCYTDTYLDYYSKNIETDKTKKQLINKYCDNKCYFNPEKPDCSIAKLEECCADEDFIAGFMAVCDDSENLYNEYCDETCEPLKLTNEAKCDVGDCNTDGNNVSSFKDPIFSGDSAVSNLIPISSDGTIDLSQLQSNLNNISSLTSLIDVVDNSFVAVAQQEETYKETIGTYCDLYCQEIAVVTLPDIYPAANAGRYFKWYISSEPENLINQKVVKICAEDIKLDDFIEDYYEEMNKIQQYIDGYANMHVTGCKRELLGAISEFVTDGNFSAGEVCSTKFTPILCCGERPQPRDCTCNASTPEQGAQCASKVQACAEYNQNVYPLLLANWKKCMIETQKQLASCNDTYPDQVRKAHEEFQKYGKNIIGLYEDFLTCFHKDYGTDISTDLQFTVESDVLRSDGSNLYDSLSDYIQTKDTLSESLFSNSICVDSQKCDQSYYSYSPNIIDAYGEKAKMTCAGNFVSTDLFTKDQTTRNTILNNCKKIANLNASNAPSNIQGMIYNQYYNSCVGSSKDSLSKLRINSVTNLVENYSSSSNGKIVLPLEVNDFTIGGQWSYGGPNGGATTDTIFNKKVNSGEIDADVNWWSTYRLLVQYKDESYALMDNVNSCVCSDGTVRDLISKDDAPSGMIVNGDYYCDCDPEESYDEYSNSTSGSSSFVEANERWGKCQYSGYMTIEEGGNYSVNYSMASGTYPLKINYWNIGSIDPSTGEPHFSNMIDKCCSDGVCVYDGELCKIIIGNAIMTDNWSNQYTNWWDLSASYYVCKNGQCKNPEPEPVCPDGECPPDTPEPNCPDGDCDNPEPEPVCPEGNCANPSGLAIIYRTVDLNDPFPNRNAGENWQNLEGKISENRGVDGTDLYSSNLKPLYYFKFTPDVIKNIRAFNSAYGRDYSTSSTIAYPNNLMVKKDENGKNIYDENGNVIYTKGISQVLNNELIVYFARAAANNGDDLDEWFDVPLIQNCDDYYKAYSNDEDGNSYCVDIQDSFVVVQGDSECWQNVGVNPAYMGGEK